MPVAELERLWQRLRAVAIDKMPLSVPPPRGTRVIFHTAVSRFGSPLVLSRVHWVRPEMVVEVSYAEWTPDGLLRHVVIWASGRISLPSTCAAIRLSADPHDG
jgi:ATP-dependent DNA ligase